MLPLGAFPHQLFSAGDSHKLSMNSLGSTLPQIFLSNVLTSFSSTVPASAVTSGSKFHRGITTQKKKTGFFCLTLFPVELLS